MKKIKASRNFSPAILIELLALGLAALLPLRVYQVGYLIEPETGFFSHFSFTIPTFYCILGALCLVFIAGSFLSSKCSAVSYPQGKCIPLGVASVLAAVSIVYDAVSQAMNFYEVYTSYSPYNASGATLLSYLTKNGATPQIFAALFGVLAAFYMWLVANSFFDGKTKITDYKILAVTPLAWNICRIIHRFVRKISFVNVSDLLLELFMLVFMMLFFLAFAQVASNVSAKEVKWRLFGFGLPAAAVALVCSVPRLAMVVGGSASLLPALHPFAPCDLFVGVFIIMFLFRLLGGLIPKNKTA